MNFNADPDLDLPLIIDFVLLYFMFQVFDFDLACRNGDIPVKDENRVSVPAIGTRTDINIPKPNIRMLLYPTCHVMELVY